MDVGARIMLTPGGAEAGALAGSQRDVGSGLTLNIGCGPFLQRESGGSHWDSQRELALAQAGLLCWGQPSSAPSAVQGLDGCGVTLGSLLQLPDVGDTSDS